MIPHPNFITASEHIDFAQHHLLEAENSMDRKESPYWVEATAHAAIADVHISLARWKAGR